MKFLEIDEADQELIRSATDIIRKNYTDDKHTVGAAVRSSSNIIYTGVNIDSCGYGPCAEPIALGAAITSGERNFSVFVAVAGKTNSVLSPCGNCRQMLLEYAPNAMVIVQNGDRLEKIPVADLLPNAYSNFNK